MPIERDGRISSKTSEKPRSPLRRLFRGIGWLSAGPVDWTGRRGISRGASFIRDLVVALRFGSQRDPQFRTSEDGGFDVEATAFLHGISVSELQRRLVLRRPSRPPLREISLWSSVLRTASADRGVDF